MAVLDILRERWGSRDASNITNLVASGARPPTVAILGAGAAGLCMALQLQDVGIDTFTIYEKGDDVGGTWRDNTYPGAACDVPSHLYSFSFAPKADWSRKFPEQPEIYDYFRSLVRDHGLEPKIRFGVEVVAADWDEVRSLWTLHTSMGETFTADVVVSGLGQLNRPNIPDIAGLDDFDGTVFHSARWNHEHDLSGERVAVIGIGASAIQFVPQVAKDAGDLTLFQRSVNYVMPKPDREFRPWEKWLLTNVPLLRKAYRASIYFRFEWRFVLMRKGSRLGTLLKNRVASELQAAVSDELPAEALIPDYTPGCRRLLIANDWYPTLVRPDVRVCTSGIERITADSIVCADGGEHEVDTIIFGTGFRATEFLSPLRITGEDGADLNEVWRDGASAFLGIAVPRFPNLFILYGPNTNLGHNSILFMIEQQVHYVRGVIADMMERGARTAEVGAEPMRRYEAEIDAAVERTVWAEDCASWYKNAAGKVTNNWPDFTLAYWRRLHSGRGDDITYGMGAERPERRSTEPVSVGPAGPSAR